MLFHEKDHAANAPSTWQVVKAAEGRWQLQTKDGVILDTKPTKRAVELLTTEGFYVELYDKEGRWFAGEEITGWKPYVEVKAEQEQLAARFGA